MKSFLKNIKPYKIFECTCADGFDGFFCEHKVEADRLLFISTTVNDFGNQFEDKLIFNKNGRLVGESASIGENSCSTMVNGEAVIFGGNHDQPTDIILQVNLTIQNNPIEKTGGTSYYLRFLWFPNVQLSVSVIFHLISQLGHVERSLSIV